MRSDNDRPAALIECCNLDARARSNGTTSPGASFSIVGDIERREGRSIFWLIKLSLIFAQLLGLEKTPPAESGVEMLRV